MIDDLPKSGNLQKGQHLSIHFFEKQISKSILIYYNVDLEDVRLRIRDLIDQENRKKGRRPMVLSEE